jgi:hypothetical protein
MTDAQANVLIDLGASHGYQQIIRLTGQYGLEHYFRSDTYHFFLSYITP